MAVRYRCHQRLAKHWVLAASRCNEDEWEPGEGGGEGGASQLRYVGQYGRPSLGATVTLQLLLLHLLKINRHPDFCSSDVFNHIVSSNQYGKQQRQSIQLEQLLGRRGK